MKTRWNKREVARTLGAKPRRSQKAKNVDAQRQPRGPRDGAPTGGANASDQRTNGQQVAPDSWNAGKRASRGQRHHAGSGHVSRLDGRGAKPTSGALADHWQGRPEIGPAARLRGVHADYYVGQARHGAEWRLLQDATEHAAGLTTAPSRHAILTRATKLAKAGSPVADKVREALIG